MFLPSHTNQTPVILVYNSCALVFTPLETMAICQYCRNSFKGQTAVSQHQAQSIATGCKQKRDAHLAALWAERRRRAQSQASLVPPQVDTVASTDTHLNLDPPSPTHTPPTPAEFDQDARPPCDAGPSPHRTTVEDVLDEDDSSRAYPAARYSQSFPDAKHAGKTFGTARTQFEHIRDEQILDNHEIWGPFADEEEWELAKWLIKNVGHNQADDFLKLPIVHVFLRPIAAFAASKLVLLTLAIHRYGPACIQHTATRIASCGTSIHYLVVLTGSVSW